MARSRVLPLLLLAAFLTELAPSFVASPSTSRPLNSARTSNVAMYAEDPLDFVGKTGKRIEANSENEQLVDLDGVWAIFFTVLGVGATFAFVSFLQGLKPS
mmetsp:Transcript_10307/g.12551  ORF Transcript_10307/g.12551 Transcript_10307/m.12551 type:complete len:101 (-) Transcript_10307:40-342(-)|eukprot:Skav228351  [mRNA]  locus=scaffold5397:40748:46034:- [translate_table: standard]